MIRRLLVCIVSLLIFASPALAAPRPAGAASTTLRMTTTSPLGLPSSTEVDFMTGAAFMQGSVAIINPATSGFAFTASADQNTVGFDGNPLLTNYFATYCLAATPTACPITIDLGKGTPDATNTITVTGGTLLWSMLTPNVAYTATVSAVGPGGASAPSNSVGPFGVESAPRGVGSTLTLKK